MGESMIFKRKLPNSFWSKAVNTSIYLQNRLPTRVVHETLPSKASGSLKLSIRHLKVFGLRCYTHVAAVKRSNLDKKAKIEFWLVISLLKGYRIYNIESVNYK